MQGAQLSRMETCGDQEYHVCAAMSIWLPRPQIRGEGAQGWTRLGVTQQFCIQLPLVAPQQRGPRAFLDAVSCFLVQYSSRRTRAVTWAEGKRQTLQVLIHPPQLSFWQDTH